jgi:DNA-binding NtrC family response regulator
MQKHSRTLVVDDHRAIHSDFRKLLVTVPNSAMSELETTLFGDVQPSADTFELDSVYQGEEGAAMVRISGPELIEQLSSRRPGLKVIYMSGYTEDAIAHHGVLAPGIAFLHKPFTSATLGRKIREVLDQ